MSSHKRACGSHLSIVVNVHFEEDGEIAFREPHRLPKRLDRLVVRGVRDIEKAARP
jgi:hypothetical protein